MRRDKRLVRTVRVKIGRTDLVRLSDARSEAKRLMATIQSGVDPTAGPASTGITLEQTLVEHLKERSLSAATVRGYQYHMDHYLKGLRKRAVADISRQDCRDLLDTLTRLHGKTTGGSVMRTVRALVNTARRHDETITANPVDAIRVPATPKRQVGELDVAAFWAVTEAM
ncbi:site-specific integrase, partial [Paracoccus sp. 2205BS29-5]